jgi:DNA-binding MarR family transcriptional regulator
MSAERKAANHDGLLPPVDRLIHEPARYNIMALLYVVESAEFLFVQNQIVLTPGNLSAHLSKLEAAGYVEIRKEFAGKMPRTILRLTAAGRTAFENYRRTMKQVFDEQPGGQDPDR